MNDIQGEYVSEKHPEHDAQQKEINCFDYTSSLESRRIT
jgi:hypothetical protein